MISLQQKQEEYRPRSDLGEEPINVVSEYFEAYRAIINEIPVDSLSSIKLFKKYGVQYNPQGPFHQFQHKIVKSFLKHQIVTIRISIAYFTLTINILNDSHSNPFAGISHNEEGKYGQLYFYPTSNKQVAIKSFDYAQEQFHFVLQRVLLEWSILKICSILQCAPQLEDIFGFDLIIYDDCIHMAMEKCIVLKKLPSKWFEILAQELETMHSFNIIHADIKPDNLVFSPSLNKPVFIDFGFSTIIKEMPGQKKKTLFKGSPGFCSPEMLNLFSASSPMEYIDLYHNDTFSLKISFNGSTESQHLQLSQDHEPSTLFSWDGLKQSKRMYFHYKFKYYYIFEDIVQLLSLLKDKNLVKTQIAILMKFMIDIFQLSFHFEVLQSLKEYYFIDQYKLIMRQVNLEKSKIRLHIKHDVTNDGYHISKDFSNRFNHLLLKDFDGQILNNLSFKSYSEFLLLGDFQTLPKERCLDLLLQCLRFNIRNTSFPTKAQVASKWKEIFSKESFQHCQQGSIDDIRCIFLYLLNYCTQRPLTQQKKNSYFEILFHSILLGINPLQNFKDYLSLMNEGGSNLLNRLALKAFLNELLDRLDALNLAAEVNALALSFHFILHQQIKKIQLEIFKVNPADYDQDVQILLFLEEEFAKNKSIDQNSQHFKRIRQIVNQVKDKRLKHYFLSEIFQRRLLYLVQRHPTNESLLFIRQMMKEENIYQNMNIHMLFQVNELFMLKLGLYQQYKKMACQITDIIGCSSFSERFKIDKYVFMLDSNNFDRNLTIKYLTELNNSYLKLEALDMGIKRHIYYLLRKLKHAQQYDIELKKLLRSLYNKFKKTNDYCLSFSQHRISDFEEILLRLDIQKLFISLLPDLLPDFKVKLQGMNTKISSMLKCVTSSDESNIVATQDMSKVFQFVELRFEYLQSQDYYHHLLGNKKQQLKYLLKLASLSGLLRLHLIYDHQCYRIILLSNYLKDNQIFSQFLFYQYQLAYSSQCPIQYLLNSKQLLLIYSLRYFHKIGNYGLIISLMTMINVWINDNPLQSYVRSYIESLEMFYLTVPTFFQYKTLKESFSCGKGSKPYGCVLLVFCALAARQQIEKIKLLKIISFMLNKLTSYAREQIFKRFNLVFASLKTIKPRKVETYLLRYNKPAFKSKPFSSFLKKRLKDKLRQCPKQATLKTYLSKLL